MACNRESVARQSQDEQDYRHCNRDEPRRATELPRIGTAKAFAERLDKCAPAKRAAAMLNRLSSFDQVPPVEQLRHSAGEPGGTAASGHDPTRGPEQHTIREGDAHQAS